MSRPVESTPSEADPAGKNESGPAAPVPQARRSGLAPGRYLMFGACLVIFIALAVPFCTDWGVAVMIGFDAAAALFLASLAPLLRRWPPERMRERALSNDANRPLLLTLGLCICAVIFLAVGYELTGPTRPALYFVIATLLIAWAFTNALFALHYAHIYFMTTGYHPLNFPGKEAPDYSDFFYFAFIIGMTCQTSDVTIADRGMRRLAMLHGISAFLFNMGALAFTVNMIGN